MKYSALILFTLISSCSTDHIRDYWDYRKEYGHECATWEESVPKLGRAVSDTELTMQTQDIIAKQCGEHSVSCQAGPRIPQKLKTLIAEWPDLEPIQSCSFFLPNIR